ncbi:hypothetical protein LV779_21425 [Streptomyces thinghirensis]|nr:hypothetical protein [Streptomyces thinghirensis]
MTGEVIGSPEFLAPERALGRTPGPESDLWSLGVLLYAAVEGRLALPSGHPAEHPAGDRRRGVAAAAPGRCARARHRGLAAQRPGRTAPGRACRAGAAGPGRRGRRRRPPARGAGRRVRPDRRGRREPVRRPRRCRCRRRAGAGRGGAGRCDGSPRPAPTSPGGRDRRARAVLVLGLVVLARSAGRTTYALLNRSRTAAVRRVRGGSRDPWGEFGGAEPDGVE